MAKHKYRILSEEAAERYGAEIGSESEIDLDVAAKKAVVAAGWVEPLDEEDEPKSKKKEG